MREPSLILIGAGGHAQSCIDVIEQQGLYQIAGLVGMPEEMNVKHLGYTVFATDNELSVLAKKYQYAVITLGQIQSADSRIRLYKKASELGFQFPLIVSPSAYVSRHANIGAGTIVMHGAIINASANVGCNCIINTRALVEHGTTIEDHCHISTGAILNGDVSVGEGSFVGSASVVKEGVSIGKGCVVGMSSGVRKNILNNSRFVNV